MRKIMEVTDEEIQRGETRRKADCRPLSRQCLNHHLGKPELSIAFRVAQIKLNNRAYFSAAFSIERVMFHKYLAA